ncbi:MAG: CDP-alcohol phosphatidyltransferase [Microbacteriaceae bacterium]|jgi:phosphatidylglycerophosphate synthase|nr:CDP-alcohol phosphatidyltransferase [Microbacteriaceae bacterium]
MTGFPPTVPAMSPPSARPSKADARGGVPPRAFRAALLGLRQAQKPGAGVPAYTRWVNRRLARYAAAAAYALGWTPNAVTVVSAAFSGAALLLLIVVPTTPMLGLAIASLLAIGYLLDSADGQVARLSKSGSPAGEWLDHVVDAVRTPAIHLAVLVGLWRTGGSPPWLLMLTLAYCLVTVGQFLSQILAEQLRRSAPASDSGRGVMQSIVLIPTDTGTLCWMFLLWGFPPMFAVVYAVMFTLNLVHTVVSMRRRYRSLVARA